jgi:hypothetical protein
MAGFDRKHLELRHDSAQKVAFMVEVDFAADGTWHAYRRITVPAGQTVAHTFPDGYSARWVRLIPDGTCTATAWFRYE